MCALPISDQEIVERQGWDEEENDAYALSRVDRRFVYEEEPSAWNRFDWVVELEPFDSSGRPEMGRAACREGGCQSVEDSGGALSITIKQTTAIKRKKQ